MTCAEALCLLVEGVVQRLLPVDLGRHSKLKRGSGVLVQCMSNFGDEGGARRRRQRWWLEVQTGGVGQGRVDVDAGRTQDGGLERGNRAVVGARISGCLCPRQRARMSGQPKAGASASSMRQCCSRARVAG